MKHITHLEEFDASGFEAYVDSIKADASLVPSKEDPRESKEYGQAFSTWKDDLGSKKDDDDLREEFEHNLQESGLISAIAKMIKEGTMDVQATVTSVEVGKSIGVYWAFKEPVETDDQDAEHIITVYGKTSYENVDWESTFVANATPDGDSELRMKSEGIVEVHGFRDSGKQTEIKPAPIKC